MEKESKIKVNRTSASAKNANDINIKVVVGDQPKKKRVYRRKPKAVAPPPPPVQNIVQLPPTQVAVPNVAFGRPQYNFTEPRPYDSPDAGGMRVISFPELQQNYQSRQELMGMPMGDGGDVGVMTAEGEPVAEEEAPAPEEEAPAPEEEAPAPEEEPSTTTTEMPSVSSVASLPQGRPLTDEEIQMIAEEAGRRSSKRVAMSALDKVLSFIYDTKDPDVLRELKASVAPPGSLTSDVWRQLGMMVSRMPPTAERESIIQLIMSETPSTSSAPLPLPTPQKKEKKTTASAEGRLTERQLAIKQLEFDIEAIPRSAKGRVARGYKAILTRLTNELKALKKKEEKEK